MKLIKRDTTAVLDYVWDWTDWLDDDTIASATVTGTGCTVNSQSYTTTKVTAWISGGSTTTAPPTATCHITTAAGRQDDRSVVFAMVDR